MSKYSDTFYNERDRDRTLYVTTCCPDVQDYVHLSMSMSKSTSMSMSMTERRAKCKVWLLNIILLTSIATVTIVTTVFYHNLCKFRAYANYSTQPE